MASHSIHSWTFSSLIGSFLDLSIAYLLLCGSTLVFFTSKFLSLFGLYLPCPCNGLFNDPNGFTCINKLLVDCPTNKISSVHMSTKSKFPFDSIFMKNQLGRQLNLKLVRESGERIDEVSEMDSAGVEAEPSSCSSFSETRVSYKNGVGFGLLNQKGVSEVKGKGILNHKSWDGSNLRRRRKASIEHGKLLRASSSDHPNSLIQQREISPSNDEQEETSGPVNPERSELHNIKEAPTGMKSHERTFSGSQMSESTGEDKNTDRDASSSGEFVNNIKRQLGVDGDEANSIKILEQALEEEHAVRIALYSELEEERNAAASAADEAMAMILRLQEEKASIEMEARQYQRVIEEKSAYDAEEMDILKEILLRREREKHFLEKEVESYRRNMLLVNESEGDTPYTVGMSQINESISKQAIGRNLKKSDDFDASSVNRKDRNSSFVVKGPSPDWDEDGDFLKRGDIHRGLHIKNQHSYVPDCKQKFQEKGMVSTDKQQSASELQELKQKTGSGLLQSNEAQGHDLHEKTVIFLDEDQKQNKYSGLCQGITSETGQIGSGTEISFPCDVMDWKKHGKSVDERGRELCISPLESENSIYDVHVIDDESKLYNQEPKGGSELLITDSNKCRMYSLPPDASCSRRNYVSSDCASTSSGPTQTDIHRSYSDMTDVLPRKDKFLDKTLLSDLQTSSIPTADYERLKLETEVERLRDRLRVVQKGREKLSLSIEHRDREQMQLQLLEDIASQLREIRQLTEPRKATRQASLPPPSTKVSSKKRRYRGGVSWGIHGSS